MRTFAGRVAVELLTVAACLLAQDSPASHALLDLPKPCLESAGVTAEVSSALQSTRTHPTAHAYDTLGILFYKSNRLNCAVLLLKASIQLQNQNWQAHYYLAQALLRLGDQSGADREMQIAQSQGGAEMSRTLRSDIEKESEIANLIQAANQLLASGNAAAAAQNYQNALRINSRNPELHYNLSVAFEKLGDLNSERKELETAVALDPNIAAAQNQLGWLALQSGKKTEAEVRFKMTLAIDPHFAEAQDNLGVLYGLDGRNVEAASLFKSAIQNDPNYSPARIHDGLLLQKQGALADAEKQFLAAIKIDPRDPDAYIALGKLQQNSGRTASAIGTLRQATTLKPDSAKAHLELGLALMDRPDRPGAVIEFSEAARLDPNFAAAHYNLGRFFFDSGKYDDAEHELRAALRSQPGDPAALFYLAATMAQEGEVEQSTALLKQVVTLQPGNADAQYLLGQELERSGDSTAAIQHWKAAVAARPDYSQALYSLARALNKVHDPAAKQYQDRFDIVLKNEQVADRVTAMGNVALQYAEAQKWPQALEQMNAAIQLCGTCPQGGHLHKNLGLFYLQMGKISEAKQELHTALSLSPDDADAKTALARVEAPAK